MTCHQKYMLAMKARMVGILLLLSLVFVILLNKRNTGRKAICHLISSQTKSINLAKPYLHVDDAIPDQALHEDADQPDSPCLNILVFLHVNSTLKSYLICLIYHKLVKSPTKARICLAAQFAWADL